MTGESYYILRPCKGSIGFTANLKKNMRLDLKECGERLKKAGYSVMDAEIMLIADKDIEITVYKSGKLLAKTDDESSAKSAIENAYKVLFEEDDLSR
jgi:TATA-box binding protein (TBP) (component of TFIID and TFIIIB)